MMGTAFLGYVYSPKWLNLSIYSVALIFLILVYYTIQKLVRKSKVLTHPCYAVNINNIKYNKLNNKSIYRLCLNNVSKRRYSTTPCLNKSGCAETSPLIPGGDRGLAPGAGQARPRASWAKIHCSQWEIGYS